MIAFHAGPSTHRDAHRVNRYSRWNIFQPFRDSYHETTDDIVDACGPHGDSVVRQAHAAANIVFQQVRRYM
jgi:hypothetical protein